MNVNINMDKYDFKNYNRHTIDESGKVALKDEREIELINKEKEVCLNCTKKKCKGHRSCFEKERNKK